MHEETTSEGTCSCYETVWARARILAYSKIQPHSCFWLPPEEAQARCALKVEWADVAAIQTTWENGTLFGTRFSHSQVLALSGSSSCPWLWQEKYLGLWLYCQPFINTSLFITSVHEPQVKSSSTTWKTHENNIPYHLYLSSHHVLGCLGVNRFVASLKAKWWFNKLKELILKT